MVSNETAKERCTAEDIKPYEMGLDGTSAMFRLLGTDYDNQLDDQQLFPGRMPDEQLRKLPPFVIFTSEFDFLRRDCLALAAKGKRIGKLLDMSDIPEAGHAL